MDYSVLLEKINNAIRRDPTDFRPYQDYFDILNELGETDKAESYRYNLKLRKMAADGMKMRGSDVAKLYDLSKKTYQYAAKDDLHSYLIFLEWERPAQERFYQPRMRVMRRVVDSLQRLANDELDELFLSMPPRVGKSTMLLFYTTWLIGRNSERSNLYSAFSDIITTAFYNGVLEVMRDPNTYLWKEVFPAARIVTTNAKDETLNVDRAKRYPSLTCRSLYGTLNGACDCNGILISDDLIGGIEEALNKDRLMAAWSKVDNNLIPRAKESAKILWCGTRWSLIDPAGLRMDLLEHDERFSGRRYEIINLPALNKDDESNFEYDYGVGFSTEFYYQRRASFERNNDMASWLSQYMGEPIERSGALFEPQDMKYFNGVLPDETGLTRIFMTVDPAFGGGDFTAAPICCQYEDGSIYVIDVLYSDADKSITQPMICEKIKRYGVQAVQFETNKSTASYREKVDEMLKDEGIKINITSKAAPNNVAKEVRIRDKAPEIRQFYFLEDNKRSKEYNLFMQNVFSFKITGKNKHDDSVDSLAMAVDLALYGIGSKLELMKRMF